MPGSGTAARPPGELLVDTPRTQQALPGPLPLRRSQGQRLLTVLRDAQLQRALLVRLGARALRVAEGVRGRRGDLTERFSRRGDGRRPARRPSGRRHRRPARHRHGRSTRPRRRRGRRATANSRDERRRRPRRRRGRLEPRRPRRPFFLRRRRQRVRARGQPELGRRRRWSNDGRRATGRHRWSARPRRSNDGRGRRVGVGLLRPVPGRRRRRRRRLAVRLQEPLHARRGAVVDRRRRSAVIFQWRRCRRRPRRSSGRRVVEAPDVLVRLGFRSAARPAGFARLARLR